MPKNKFWTRTGKRFVAELKKVMFEKKTYLDEKESFKYSLKILKRKNENFAFYAFFCDIINFTIRKTMSSHSTYAELCAANQITGRMNEASFTILI